MKIKPHPIQKWPERTPLDVIKSISHHLKDKSVCDIGCGAGDLLYEIRRTGLSNNIVGVELQYKFIQMIEKVGSTDRDYIIRNDFTKIDIPKADVYLIWIDESDFNNNHKCDDCHDIILGGLPNSIIVDLSNDPSESHLKKMEEKLYLIEKIDYDYNEEKYGLEGPPWSKPYDVKQYPLIGTRKTRIYEKRND
tara:strand:- start:44 stop:622 length:579 start_codon:yes stop_codon:yes gene_type:complete